MNWTRIEKGLQIAIGLGIVVVLALQLSSLYVAPIHNSHLWYGDESWLMSEYREQMSSGVFRHPGAIASTLQIGNPFPFTVMWVPSVLYGGAAHLFSTSNLVDVGRTVSALIALVIVALIVWRVGRDAMIPALCGVALLISCRSFLFASHCARYDIITAATVLLGMMYLSRRERFARKELLTIGVSFGACLLVSAHAAVILVLPVAFVALRSQRNLIKLIPMGLACVGIVGSLYVLHLITQPTLPSTHDVTYSVGDQPIMQPLSLSFQKYNLQHKVKLIINFALPMLLMLAIILAVNLRTRNSEWSNILFWTLPVIGWLFLEAGAVTYLVYILPALAFGAATSISRVRRSTQLVIVPLALISLIVASFEAVQARENGLELTYSIASAVGAVKDELGEGPIIAMNQALTDLENDPQFGMRTFTTHFVLLPYIPPRSGARVGSLLVFVRGGNPYFSWEAPILRDEIRSPELTLTGKFIDAKRSYFKPLDRDLDTLLIQQFDFDTMLQHYRR